MGTKTTTSQPAKKKAKRKRKTTRKAGAKKKRAKPGPKVIQIDWETAGKLAALHCTAEEIASVLGCSSDTLARRCQNDHKMALVDYIADRRAIGRVSLRRKQYELAMSGDRTMLVWLGKNNLGQTDKREHSGPGGRPLIPEGAMMITPEQLRGLTDEQLGILREALTGSRKDTDGD